MDNKYSVCLVVKSSAFYIGIFSKEVAEEIKAQALKANAVNNLIEKVVLQQIKY